MPRSPPVKNTYHHAPDSTDAPPPASALRDQLRASDYADLTGSLRSFGTCVELSQTLAPLVDDDELVARVVDAAVADAARHADVGPCLRLMAEGDYLSAHDVCVGYLEKPSHDHGRDAALSVIAALCEAELVGAGYGGVAELVGRLEALDTLPCGCEVDAAPAAPFFDLGKAFARLDACPRLAYGHALAAAAAGPDFGRVAAAVAREADATVDVAGEADATVEDTSVEEEVSAAEDPTLPPSLRKLERLVAVAPAKHLCRALRDAVALDTERGDDLGEKSFSAVFRGNPGTGKTTSMRLYGSLLEELGVMPSGKVVEVTGGELAQGGVDGFEALMKKSFKDPQKSILKVGDQVEVKRGQAWGNFGTVTYVDKGGTYDVKHGDQVEIKAPRHHVRDPREEGGTLLVDEAYQLDPAGSNTGRRIVELLVKEMDARGGRLAVVLAGYDKEMDAFLGSNPGLPSRFRKVVEFPDFLDDELVAVAENEFERRFASYHLEDAKHLRIAARRLGKGRGAPGFGNARAVGHLLDNAWEKQTRRAVASRKGGGDPDVFEWSREDLLGERTLDMDASDSLRALRAMEGLDNVKAAVEDLLRVVETNAEREDREEPSQKLSLNRVFLGNPGTGKTTVAGLYGKILNELGFLSSGDVVLSTPSDFVGSALGQSEEKTNALLDRARGCVLVIDEAYGLDPSAGAGGGGVGSGGDPFKSAVVDALVSRVQGDAGADICVLLLGYERPMAEFLRKANPGLARRFNLETAFRFDDYDDQALLKILLGSVKKRGLTVSLADAKTAVRQRLAKQRLRPNFGNAGAVENLVSEAVARAERRLADLPPAERALRNDLVVDDLYVEAPHVADPSLVFAGLIGCEAVKAKLHEYKSVVEAARLVGRDGMEDLGMTFAFQGAPGTGKTTVARRMGMLFEALGVLPSSEVVQVSASDLVTGYVGQAARKTRDVFESARGAVLFIDEAYRLYDPTGRSYFQEAVDEIVTILTEEDFKNKMVVVFAGYAGEMQILLDKVNPGLKSRVSEVVDFPNFDHVDAAEIAAGLLEGKRLDVSRVPRDLLAAEARRLVAAPQWANGRDVEAWCRRVAVECATRGDAAVSLDAISAAADFIIAQKAPAAAVQPPVVDLDLSSLFLAEDAVAAPPSVELDVQTNADQNDDGGDSGGAGPLEDYDGALEEAATALGYGASPEKRQAFADAVASGNAPDDVVARVLKTRGGDPAAVASGLAPQISAFQKALRVSIDVRKRARDDDDDSAADPDSDELTEDEVLSRLRDLGPCPMGFAWHREGAGWRCGGGSHYVFDDDPILQG